MTNFITKNNTHRQRRRGFTLTEIAIVLGIIGLILGAIWVAAAAVYNNLRVSHANTEILQIAQAVRGLYGNASSTGVIANTILTPTLINAKTVPSDMVNVAGTGLIDPFPGGTTGVLTPTTADSFTIEMTDVPNDACINLLMSVAGSNRDPGLFEASAAPDVTNAIAAGDVLATASTAAIDAVIATPVLANGAVAGNFGGCTAAAGAQDRIKFGFGLKS
jgi:prepilin-type N-terminal cleavage/methylation domain-containing protein